MAKQLPQNDDLKKRLEAMGLTVKPAPGQQNAVIVTQPKPNRGAPAQPAYVPTQTWGLGQQAAPYGIPAAVRQRQQAPANRPVYGPPTQAQAQSMAPARRSQPPLPAPAADRVRQQYAQVQAQPGSFVTDTNQGLLQTLMQMGLRPKPYDQWQSVLSRLSQMPGT